MAKLELDDQILEHPKFIRAVNKGGSDVVHLWLGLRAYCGQKLSDGHVPTDMVEEVRGPKAPKRRAEALEILIEVGLIERRPDGLFMHDYLQWSRSKEQVLADRARARERQQRSRGGGGGGPEGGGNGGLKGPSRRDEPRDKPRDAPRDNGRDTPGGHAVTSGNVTMASASSSPSSTTSPSASQNARAPDKRIAERVRQRPWRAGEPPAPRHDPLGERFGIERWWPSQEILDWARGAGLSDRAFDEAIEDARLKLSGPGHVDWWDAKILKFLQSAIRRTVPTGPRESEAERTRAEQAITEQRRAELAKAVGSPEGDVDPETVRARLARFTGAA